MQHLLTRCRDKLDAQGGKYDVDELWHGALPTKQFVRFEATKTRPRKLPCVLMVSPRKRQVFVIKCKEIPNYEARRAIPNNVGGALNCRVADY